MGRARFPSVASEDVLDVEVTEVRVAVDAEKDDLRENIVVVEDELAVEVLAAGMVLE